MDKAQNLNDSECNTPLLEPFRIEDIAVSQNLRNPFSFSSVRCFQRQKLSSISFKSKCVTMSTDEPRVCDSLQSTHLSKRSFPYKPWINAN
jgi:hypothetical protein